MTQLPLVLTGPFTRWFCNEEMAEARKAGLKIVGVMEEDPRFGRPNLQEERRRALTGGEHGGPVHPEAEVNIELLHQVCFIPRRTQEHEVHAMVDEINRQGLLPLRRSSSMRASFRVSSSQSTSLTEVVAEDDIENDGASTTTPPVCTLSFAKTS